MAPVRASERGLTGVIPGEGPGPAALPSLRRNSSARLAADLVTLIFSLVAATIAARVLGPSGKGYYSSVLLLGGLVLQVFSAGLGEAAIVLSGSGRATLQEAASATAAAMVPLSAAAFFCMFVASVAVLPTRFHSTRAILFASAMVSLNVIYNTSVCFLLARERVVPVAVVATVAAAVSTGLLWVFLVPAYSGTAGALLGGLIGSGVAVAAVLILLSRSGLSIRPRLSSAYLKRAARFGSALQFSNLLVQLTARIDLLLVYRLASAADAGDYSISLTVGALVASVPLALAYAAFPRLAVVQEQEARTLTTQVVRMGGAAALMTGAVLALATPAAVPMVFGSSFAGSVAPTLILIPAGVLWSGQWLLCRAAAARGVPKPLLMSFAASFVLMVALDFALVPRLASVGAALASASASLLGLLIAFTHYRRLGWRARDFLPRWNDVRALMAYLRHLVARRPVPASPVG